MDEQGKSEMPYLIFILNKIAKTIIESTLDHRLIMVSATILEIYKSDDFLYGFC